jgi:rhamnosyltransferase
MEISIIIPTLNAGENFKKLFQSILSQSILDYEVIVIDSSSTDDTQKIARLYNAKLLIIPRNDFDHGGTRTKAALEAKGKYIIFLSQDVILYNNSAIRKLIEALKKTDIEIALAYGRQLPRADSHIFAKHLRMYNYPTESYVRSIKDKNQYKIKCAMFSDAFAAYKMTTLEQLGYLKNGLIWGEDLWACAKALLNGNNVAYVADAIVYHSHDFSVFQEFKRYFDAGVMLKKEHWILTEFGEASDEGIKYVKSCIFHLIENNKYYLVIEFFVRMLMKYLGYTIGKKERFIPSFVKQKLSMNPIYWVKNT